MHSSRHVYSPRSQRLRYLAFLILSNEDNVNDFMRHRAMITLTSVVANSISHALATNIFLEHISINSAEIIWAVKDHLPKSNISTHHHLQHSAENTKLVNYHSIDDFSTEHEGIRTQMISSGYPEITSECTTIQFFCKDISTHPDSALLYI